MSLLVAQSRHSRCNVRFYSAADIATPARCRHQSLSLFSTSGQQRRSALLCRRRCARAPTRLLNEAAGIHLVVGWCCPIAARGARAPVVSAFPQGLVESGDVDGAEAIAGRAAAPVAASFAVAGPG